MPPVGLSVSSLHQGPYRPPLTPQPAANYASFGPLVQRRAADPASESAAKTVSLLLKGLFGIFLVLVILLVEKLTIQVM